MKNFVTSKYMAVINGKSTGLAGCVRQCEGCIRGDSMLEKSQDFARVRKVSECRRSISY